MWPEQAEAAPVGAEGGKRRHITAGVKRIMDHMLERYFVKPSTVDRILACWLARQIERYT